MPDGVHALVKAMKATRVDPPPHGTFVKANRTQLPGGDDTMLPGGNLRKLQIGWGAFLLDTDINAPGAKVLPPARANLG